MSGLVVDNFKRKFGLTFSLFQNLFFTTSIEGTPISQRLVIVNSIRNKNPFQDSDKYLFFIFIQNLSNSNLVNCIFTLSSHVNSIKDLFSLLVKVLGM